MTSKRPKRPRAAPPNIPAGTRATHYVVEACTSMVPYQTERTDVGGLLGPAVAALAAARKKWYYVQLVRIDQTVVLDCCDLRATGDGKYKAVSNG